MDVQALGKLVARSATFASMDLSLNDSIIYAEFRKIMQQHVSSTVLDFEPLLPKREPSLFSSVKTAHSPSEDMWSQFSLRPHD